MTTTPSYITKNRCGIFYFQYRIPTHFIQNGTSRRLFRKSLHTRDRREAIKLARRWAIRMDDLAAHLFKTPEAFGKAMELLMAYNRLEPYGWESVEELLMGLDEREEELLNDALAYDKVKRESTKELVEENETLKRTLELLHAGGATSSSITGHQSHPDAPLLSKLIEDYITDMGVEWDSKHRQGNERDLRPRLESFLEIIGDKPCDAITREEVARFKDITLKLPANRKKKAAYRNKTIDELLKMDVPESDRLSPTSINKNLEKASSFLHWCYENSSFVKEELWYPLTRRVKDDVADSERRDAFSDEDLRKLFLSEQYVQGSHKQPAHFWIPLLGFFTGARLNELCQLYRDDVYKDPESSIWVIDINDKTSDKKLKKKSHARIVPIHHTLISLGFISFVESFKTERLFPELTLKRDGYQDMFSKWFNRTYRNDKHCDVGNGTGEKKNFHSFRHTFINHLEKKGIPQPQVARLVGQTPKDGSVTTSTYGKKNSIQENYNIILKLPLAVNFGQIKVWGKF